MNVDVIIASLAKTPEHRKMTNDAIMSLFKSEESHNFNIIVLEGNKNTTYQGVTTVHYDGPFIYNEIMNIGTELGSAKWVVWANNDIVFHPGWFSEILKQYRVTGIKSWGSYAPDWPYQNKRVHGEEYIEGYQIGIHLTGWVITTRREIWNEIGKLNTYYSFYYADYSYAEQLVDHGIKHALACKSKVSHLLNQTFKTMSIEEKREFNDANRIRYEKLCKERGYRYPQIYTPLDNIR